MVYEKPTVLRSTSAVAAVHSYAQPDKPLQVINDSPNAQEPFLKCTQGAYEADE